MNKHASRLIALAAAAAASLTLAVPAFAHHSFAMYDLKQQIELKGVVKEYHWSNPHTFIDLMVTEKGQPVVYGLEGQQVRLMVKAGFRRDSLQTGDKVTILINPMRDGSVGGHFLKVTKADGTVLGNAATLAAGAGQ
jgi:hypothetical protein